MDRVITTLVLGTVVVCIVMYAMYGNWAKLGNMIVIW